MRHRSAVARTAILAAVTALAVPSPAIAHPVKYPGDYCRGDSGDNIVPDFDGSVSRPIIRKGETTTYTLRFDDPFNHVEVDFFANGEYVSGTVIHHQETSVARVTIRPREDTTITWSGAIFCSPDMHYDMAPGLSPATVQVVQSRRPWNRIVQVQRSLLGDAR